MAIRLPLTTVLDYNQTTEQGGGPASVAGGVAKAFYLPQDTDNVVVKMQASVKGGGVSVTFQTSDDGGTTWYDVARSSIVSNANNDNAEWLSIPVVSTGIAQNALDTVALGSVVGKTTGRAAASSLGVSAFSGLPILGQHNRVFLRYTAAITSVISERVTVMANSQSATA